MVNITKEMIINRCVAFVKQRLRGDSSGHDWWHVYRVWKLALQIAEKEEAEIFVVELAALLHDVADWKFENGDDRKGVEIARQWMTSCDLPHQTITHVCQIIHDISFKGEGVSTPMNSLEGMIVQDADRLDAMGAIGIARAFAYGGYKNREMHNPSLNPVFHQSFEEYKNNQSTTINHFYEKLLLLKDRMNTSFARTIAEERHLFMQNFLRVFYQEWEALS